MMMPVARVRTIALAAVFAVQAAALDAAPSEDALCFVQFHHPGDEHEPDTPTQRTWNRGYHRRKFLLQRAVFLASPGAKPSAGEAVFWAEWEPPSLLVRKFEKPAQDEPRFLFRPVLGSSRRPRRRTRTPTRSSSAGRSSSATASRTTSGAGRPNSSPCGTAR